MAKTNHVKSSDCVSNEGAKLILLSSAFINPYALTWFRYSLLDLCLVRPLIKSFMSKCLLTNSTDSNVVTQLFFQNSGGFSNHMHKLPNNFSHLSFASTQSYLISSSKMQPTHCLCCFVYFTNVVSQKNHCTRLCVDPTASVRRFVFYLYISFGHKCWWWSCTLSHSFWNVGFQNEITFFFFSSDMD